MSWWIGLVLAAGAVVSATAACSSEAEPSRRVADAVESTMTAETARTSSTVTLELGDGGDTQLVLTGEGEVDFAEDRAAMELRMPGMGRPLRHVVDGATTYTRIPDGVGDGEAGWLRREGDASESALGAGVGLAIRHPARLLEALDAAEADVAELGSGEIHGNDVEGFAVALPAHAGGDGTALAELAGPMEAWLDADDRVRELVATFDLPAVMAGGTEARAAQARAAQAAPGVDAEGSLRLLIELFDFGAATDIRVPADDEAIDADALEERLLPGLSRRDEPAPRPARRATRRATRRAGVEPACLTR